jgi:hypothetical protein
MQVVKIKQKSSIKEYELNSLRDGIIFLRKIAEVRCA